MNSLSPVRMVGDTMRSSMRSASLRVSNWSWRRRLPSWYRSLISSWRSLAPSSYPCLDWASMDYGAVVARCRGLPGAAAGYPFGEGALVFEVGGKMFAILSAEGVSLKCDPVFAVAFREQYPAVTARYHLDKRHWNTVLLNDSVPSDVLDE